MPNTELNPTLTKILTDLANYISSDENKSADSQFFSLEIHSNSWCLGFKGNVVRQFLSCDDAEEELIREQMRDRGYGLDSGRDDCDSSENGQFVSIGTTSKDFLLTGYRLLVEFTAAARRAAAEERIAEAREKMYDAERTLLAAKKALAELEAAIASGSE